MRRIMLKAIGFYLATAVATRAAEAAKLGINRLSCACEPECWCKRPGLTLFVG